MGIQVSEFLPTVTNVGLQIKDKLNHNNVGITKKIQDGEFKVDFNQLIDPEKIAGELNNGIEWMNQRPINLVARYGEPETAQYARNCDVPGNGYELKQMKKDRRVVNAIRVNGDGAFVTQAQREHVAYNISNRVVGNRNEFSYGDSQNPTKAKDRQSQWDGLHDRIAVALGHKATIQRLENERNQEK